MIKVLPGHVLGQFIVAPELPDGTSPLSVLGCLVESSRDPADWDTAERPGWAPISVPAVVFAPDHPGSERYRLSCGLMG